MTLLSSRFGQKAAPVTLSYQALREVIVAGNPDSYERDRDYTDVVFRIMGIARVHHPLAVTTRYLTDPQQTFALGSAHALETPLELYGSAGLFVTVYKTLPGWGDGLALILRDQIIDVAHCQPDKNVVIGLKGLNTGGDRFLVTGIACGKIDKKGHIIGLEHRSPAQKDADTALALAAILMRQMRDSKRLDLTAGVGEVRGLSPEERINPAVLLNSGPR